MSPSSSPASETRFTRRNQASSRAATARTPAPRVPAPRTRGRPRNRAIAMPDARKSDKQEGRKQEVDVIVSVMLVEGIREHDERTGQEARTPLIAHSRTRGRASRHVAHARVGARSLRISGSARRNPRLGQGAIEHYVLCAARLRPITERTFA